MTRRPSGYGVLLTSVVASVAVQGAVPPGPVQRIVVTVLLAANLLLALRVGRVSPALTRLGVAIACIGVAVSVAHALDQGIGEAEARVMNAAVVLLGPPAVALGVLRDLRDSGVVRLAALAGVLSLFMMLGLLFGFVYGALDRLGGDPFFASGVAATTSRCLYFSFTTLTTVGYGDLTARSDLGHTLAVFEAMIGQIYLVTVVSLIVSNLRREAPRR